MTGHCSAPIEHRVFCYNGAEARPIEDFRLWSDDEAPTHQVEAQDVRVGDWIVATTPYDSSRSKRPFREYRVTQTLAREGAVTLVMHIGYGLRLGHNYDVHIQLHPTDLIWVYRIPRSTDEQEDRALRRADRDGGFVQPAEP
ncbi:hypothetical protein SEA_REDWATTLEHOG_183 [Gordonia phage RedWattleHog]|uniref:Uncharacterized protein n=1 Tax=Gordonia phage Stormageddon TaxID=2656541 RepID=A0A649VS72_9CAUD|nr:hypothetical protein KHQ86_gp116 [Gordonia phage Stormageddon]QGJ95044.1 hypothetical protein SEA_STORMAGEDDON_184 [Gordonia phage Stormageddon]QLF83686.1 hypothetical protein SEA_REDWATTLEHOG_183 [Gordonia phage RedWattleHog]